MDGGEGAAALDDLMAEAMCDHTEDKENWECKLEGAGTSKLVTNLLEDRQKAEPVVPPSLLVKDCDKDHFPAQAHHLIPHKQLKVHAAAHYLAESKKKLWHDNNYSVNHGNNLKYMPYATPLKDWIKAKGDKKQDVADELMSQTGIQLHQGPHSKRKYDGAKAGYKERVDKYLGMISDEALSHYQGENPCEFCKDAEKKGKQPPRRNIVEFVDQASASLEMDINAGEIFVSKRAAQFAADYS